MISDCHLLQSLLSIGRSHTHKVLLFNIENSFQIIQVNAIKKRATWCFKAPAMVESREELDPMSVYCTIQLYLGFAKN